MQLQTLIAKLENAAWHANRRVWQSVPHGYDLQQFDLYEMLEEAAKELKKSAPNR